MKYIIDKELKIIITNQIVNYDKRIIFGRKRKKTIAISSFLLVRSMGLEPIRSPIRPSNVRVCLFRHDRKQDVI